MVDPLTPGVRKLLSEWIETVAQLHLLLFMHSQRERSWLPEEASAELRSNPSWIQTQLEQLARRGLLERDGQAFIYRAPPDLDRTIFELSDAYKQYPVAVISAIYAPDPDLKQFADAFRLRRDPEKYDDKESSDG